MTAALFKSPVIISVMQFKMKNRIATANRKIVVRKITDKRKITMYAGIWISLIIIAVFASDRASHFWVIQTQKQTILKIKETKK